MVRFPEILSSVRDNLANLFTLLGIGLTVYFAVFYVPSYVEDANKRKVQLVHDSLLESVQELVYNNLPVDSDDLSTLIRGKELSKGIAYPFTSDELLIQVQEKFLSNNFIPLEQRKALIEKIDDLRETLPPPVEPPAKEDSNPWGSILSWVSSLFGVLVGVLGIVSIWVRSRALEEAKLEATIEDRKESIRENVHAGLQMERQMYDELKGYLGQEHVEYCPPSTPVDFIIHTKSGKDIGVEVKYTGTDLIPSRTASHLISAALDLKMPIVLVANAPLTAAAHKRLAAFNHQHGDIKITYLNINESEDLEKDVKKIFA